MSNDEILNRMIGRTFKSVTGQEGGDELIFLHEDGSSVKFFHGHECCESVSIEDIIGELKDLEGYPILKAEERQSYNEVADESVSEGSNTWTFYEFATIKGSVTVRWYGTSNGYYSERVDIKECSLYENQKEQREDSFRELIGLPPKYGKGVV